MNPYPLKFENIFKETVWGGQNLARVLKKPLPEGKRIGESWEVADCGADSSVVRNGVYGGLNLGRLCKEFPHDLLGLDLVARGIKRFPLLIKFLDARDRLSVQVHPDDDYALRNEEGEWGKTEMWYVIDAAPGARLVYGLEEGVSREPFAEASRGHMRKLERLLNWVEVKPGDVFFISPGCLHAVGEGVILYEAQQSSDITYRIYDWGRVGPDGRPRQLHVEKGLQVIDFDFAEKPKIEPIEVEDGKSYLAACRYFAVELMNIRTSVVEKPGGRKFHVLSILDGDGVILSEDGDTEVKKGESVLIPAAIHAYRIEGQLRMIKSYVPDLKRDVVDPLRDLGRSDEDIGRLGNDVRCLLHGSPTLLCDRRLEPRMNTNRHE